MNVHDDPNAEQREFWRNADVWVRQQERLDTQLGHIGVAAMDAVEGLQDGANVLDVGCGCGQTSLQWAERLGGSGSVLGLDISETLIEVARRRADERAAELPGAAPVSFAVADAQTADIAALAQTSGIAALGADATGSGSATDAREPGVADSGSNGAFRGFDLVYSRFGVMFFADPAAAFANLRAATQPGGQLAFVCWQKARQNPWLITVNKAVLEVVEMPEGGPSVDPFAFADTDFVRGVLGDAGWTRVALESFETEVLFGGGPLSGTVEFAMDLGIARRALAGHPPETHARVREAVTAALTPYATPAGVVFPAAAWIVTARN